MRTIANGQGHGRCAAARWDRSSLLCSGRALLAGPCVTLVPLQSGKYASRPEQSRGSDLRRTRPALRLTEDGGRVPQTEQLGCFWFGLTTGQRSSSCSQRAASRSGRDLACTIRRAPELASARIRSFQRRQLNLRRSAADKCSCKLSHGSRCYCHDGVARDAHDSYAWEGSGEEQPLRWVSGGNSGGGGDGGQCTVIQSREPGLWVAVLQGSGLWNASDLLPSSPDREFELRWSPPWMPSGGLALSRPTASRFARSWKARAQRPRGNP